MKVGEFLSWATSALKSVSSSPDLDAELLLAAVLEKPRPFVLARPEYLLSTIQKQRVGVYLQQRLRGLPVAYILGKCEFYGREFLVNEHVLIPRPETEAIVERAIALLKNGGTLIDVGTGSGCIAVSVILANPSVQAVALDISSEALEVAKANAKLHGVAVEFYRSDLLAALKNRLRVSSASFSHPVVIAANLPYCPVNERHPSTCREPDSAIYSGTDGLDHYRRFFTELSECMFDFCLFEFHPPQQKEIDRICSALFPDASGEFVKDLAGLCRTGVLSQR